MVEELEKLQVVVLILALLLSFMAGASLVSAQRQIGPGIRYVPPEDTSNYDAPTIKVASPIRQAYDSHDVLLNFTVTKPDSWNSIKVYDNVTEFLGIIGRVVYKLDGLSFPMRVSDNWTSKSSLNFFALLTNLPNGLHSVSVNASGWCLFAPYVFGDRFVTYVEGFSETVVFTVDSAPKIGVISPRDTIYGVNYVPLNFTVDELVSSITYSLDGRFNTTVEGNSTLLNLSDGKHSLCVYAQVPTGNIGASALVNFTVDIPPKVVVLSPSENRDYNLTLIPVNFAVDKEVVWVAYSLDGQKNVTLQGNTSLAVGSYGNHTLTIFAEDPLGYQGCSNTVTFAKFPVVAPLPTTALPLHDRAMTWIIVGSTSSIVAFLALAVVVLRRQRRRRNLSNLHSIAST